MILAQKYIQRYGGLTKLAISKFRAKMPLYEVENCDFKGFPACRKTLEGSVNQKL